MSDAALLRQMPVVQTQVPTVKRQSRRWSFVSLVPASIIRSARPAATAAAQQAPPPPAVIPTSQTQAAVAPPNQPVAAPSAAAAASTDSAAAKRQRRDGRRSSWAPSNLGSSSTRPRRLSLSLISPPKRTSSHLGSTSDGPTSVDVAAPPPPPLQKQISDTAPPSLRLTLTASTHRDGFYRTSEAITGLVSLPRFDAQGREIRGVKVELVGTMTVHLLHEVPAGPLSAQTKAVPRGWHSTFHHQVEQLLEPSDVRTTQSQIELPLRFVLPARTSSAIVKLGTPLPPSLKLGRTASLRNGAFSTAAVKEADVPSAEIKYEVVVHVKREGATHKLKGLMPAKRENLASVVPVRPHAVRQTTPVREIGLIPLPAESEALTTARQRRRSAVLSGAPSTPPLSRADDPFGFVSDSRRSSMSSEWSGARMSVAMQRESGLSLMETSQGLQGWRAHRITSALNGRGNVEVEISWPAQSGLPVGAWVPFSLKTQLPSEVTLAGTTASSIRLLLLRSTRSLSPTGQLAIEEDHEVPLDVRLDAPASSPPGDEYGSTSNIMGKMRVHEGVDSSGQAPIPSFNFRRLRVEYRLVLAVSLRGSAYPRTPGSGPSSAMAYTVTLQAPVQVVCDAEILAEAAERRERRMSNRLVRNAVDAALARLEGRSLPDRTAQEAAAAGFASTSAASAARAAPEASTSATTSTLAAQSAAPAAVSTSAAARASNRSSTSSGRTAVSYGSEAPPRRSFSDRVPVTYPADIAPSSPQRSPRSSSSPTRADSPRARLAPIAVKPALSMVPASPTTASHLPSGAQLQSLAALPELDTTNLSTPSPIPDTSNTPQAPPLHRGHSIGSVVSDCSASRPDSPGLPPSYLCSVQPR